MSREINVRLGPGGKIVIGIAFIVALVFLYAISTARLEPVAVEINITDQRLSFPFNPNAPMTFLNQSFPQGTPETLFNVSLYVDPQGYLWAEYSNGTHRFRTAFSPIQIWKNGTSTEWRIKENG